MTDTPEVQTETPARRPPARKKRKVAKRAKLDKTEVKPVKGGEFAGVSSTACCSACTENHCVISTVGVCKHPYKTGDSGCGPITMANREKVRKIIKHQIIDLNG